MSDQAKRPVETPRSWVQYALGDLGVAEREMQYTEPAYHTVCFLCQSAAEALSAAHKIRDRVLEMMKEGQDQSLDEEL